MKIFFDTMVFLHYQSIDQIKLDDLFGPSPHVIIMPRITLRELDKHKNTHSSSRIRERARKIMKKIELWTAGEQVRQGVGMELMSGFPTVDYHTLGLNPDWADDILIASVLQYKTDHSDDAEITLVTQDSCPRLTASQLGLRVCELPEEYKLPVELDPLESQNRELLRTISALQNALPKFSVLLAGCAQSEGHARFTLPCPPKLIESEIKQKIEQLRAQLPKQHPPKKTPPNSNFPIPLLQGQLHSLRYSDIPAEEYDRYNQGVDKYLNSYERYLKDAWEAQAAMKRTICFEITIWNIGTAPAKDVDVLFHFPNGFRLYTKNDFPDLPKEPEPPCEPRTKRQQMTENFANIGNFNFGRLNQVNFTPPNSFSIKRSHSYDLRDHFEQIKHGVNVCLPQIFLTFDSYQTATSFSCDYTIRPANLPSPITGSLHFVIEKEDGTKTNSAVIDSI